MALNAEKGTRRSQDPNPGPSELWTAEGRPAPANALWLALGAAALVQVVVVALLLSGLLGDNPAPSPPSGTPGEGPRFGLVASPTSRPVMVEAPLAASTSTPTVPPAPTQAPTATPTPGPTKTPTAAPTPVPTATPEVPPEVEAVAAVRPAVVRLANGRSVGTGVIYDSRGYVLTNYHVVRGASMVGVTLADGRRVEGQVVEADERQDLAVVRVAIQDLPQIRWGDSDRLRLGEPLLAIGYVLDLPGEPTVSRGVFSARRNDAAMGVELVQTDTPINPGNSGGPLLNLRGEVVGINTKIRTGTIQGAPVQGINYAIASNSARAIVDRVETSP